MRRIACIGLLLTGCFYIDPINQRPSVTIRLQQPGNDAHRGDRLLFMADYDDPEHQPGQCTWTAVACAGQDEGRAVDCDDDFYAFYSKTLDATDTADLVVPMETRVGHLPVQAIKVTIAARDDRGALTQSQEEYRVDDRPPTLEMRKSAHSYVVGAPIELFAKYGDVDDGAQNVTLSWTVYSPRTQPAYTLTDLDVTPDPRDPAHVTAGKTLVSQGTGEWDVMVTATDKLGKTTTQHLLFTVGADQPPCLLGSQPVVPPSGASLPVGEPTVFQVPLVGDDLDAYPPLFGQPQFGTTKFAWSIKSPGAAARQLLVGATGNSIDFDPDAFTPGDLVEVRVEIFDRHDTPITCADHLATCSVIAQSACLQRQTWSVEIR